MAVQQWLVMAYLQRGKPADLRRRACTYLSHLVSEILPWLKRHFNWQIFDLDRNIRAPSRWRSPENAKQSGIRVDQAGETACNLASNSLHKAVLGVANKAGLASLLGRQRDQLFKISFISPSCKRSSMPVRSGVFATAYFLAQASILLTPGGTVPENLFMGWENLSKFRKQLGIWPMCI